MTGQPVVHAVLIDDDADEGPLIAALLDVDPSLSCTWLQPSATFADTVHTARKLLGLTGPRIALLDYRLDDHEVVDGGRVEYRGGTVAGFLRDVDPEIPVVLLTSDDKLRAWVQTRPGVESVFDWTLVKSGIVLGDKAEKTRARVADLATSWAKLKLASEKHDALWTELAAVLATSRLALEPFARLETSPPRADVPGAMARWLLNRALAWDGPLVRDAQARAALGITADSLELKEVQTWLDDGLYVGPLQTFGRRWWSSLIHEKLSEAAGDGVRPIAASERAATIASVTGAEVTPEFCQWCDGERTVRACWLCGRHSDAAHAIRILGDALPAWAEARVVCYSCIAEGNAEHVDFAPDTDLVVHDLRTGRLSQEK